MSRKPRVQVNIPKGYYSFERFLSQKVFILKGQYGKEFISEGHYSEDVHPEGSLFQRFFIPKDLYSERFLSRRVVIMKFRIMTLQDESLWNNDPFR